MYNQSGLYSYTTQSSSGCDSTVELDLNISYSHQLMIQCRHRLSMDRWCVYEQSMDTVVYALTSISGCDSLVRLVLEVQEIDSAIVMIDDFTLGQIKWCVYQWYNCDNGFSLYLMLTHKLINLITTVIMVEITIDNLIRVGVYLFKCTNV